MEDKLNAIHDDVKEIKADMKDHMGRMNRVETDVSWLKGHANLTVGAILAIIAGVLLYYFTGQ